MDARSRICEDVIHVKMDHLTYCVSRKWERSSWLALKNEAIRWEVDRTARSNTIGPSIAAFVHRQRLYISSADYAEISKYFRILKNIEVEI